jgi:hypothetical protein
MQTGASLIPPGVRQPVTFGNSGQSHIIIWSHKPRARIPVPPQRADGFDLEARPLTRPGLLFVADSFFIAEASDIARPHGVRTPRSHCVLAIPVTSMTAGTVPLFSIQ